MRLLLLEDDAPLADRYSRRLRSDGFAVDQARTIEEARLAISDVDYDCLVMDRRLPDGDALELVGEFADHPDRVAVLLVSGTFDQPPDVVRGLEAGADDYLAKPVRLDELAVRVRRLTARTASQPREVVIRLGRASLDRGRREVYLDDEPVHLTSTQYAVFSYLAEHQDRLVPIEELLDHCWDRNRDLFANPAHSQISRLRRIFDGALRFESVRGEGYAIRVEPDAA